MSLAAGGLAVGAVLTESNGVIVAEGRNRAYDPPGGSDVLQGTPLAHGEMNVLAAVRTEAELGDCILWSTQEPCSMCSAAAAFTGVGELRHIAPDPWTIAAQAEDPSVEASKALRSVGPAEDEWVVCANVFFLLGVATKRGRDAPVLQHNLDHEPETAGIIVELLQHGQTAELWTSGRAVEEALADTWPRILTAAGARRQRLG